MSWQETYEYACGIKITFDKPIVSDTETITGSEFRILRAPAGNEFASSVYQTLVAANVADDNVSTYWRPSNAVPVWVGFDYVGPVELSQMRLYAMSSHRPRAYKIQGSADNSTWTDLASGEFTNVEGWKTVYFTAATYRYWRVYITSLWSSRCYVAEVEFWREVDLYSANGFSVSAEQYNKSPEGIAENHQYTIKKVTKSVDGLELTIWLEPHDRLGYPSGAVTVEYDKSVGGLTGEQSAQVESFSRSFTPTPFDLFFDPAISEKIDLTLSHENELMRIYYQFYQSDEDGNISVDITSANEIIHVNDLEN